MKSPSKQIKTILTKKHDGGTSKKRRILRSSDRHLDPFSYWSSQEVRLSALRCRREEIRSPKIPNEEGNQEPASASSASDGEARASDDRPTAERQTRLSFEMHPSLMMMDMLDSIFDE